MRMKLFVALLLMFPFLTGFSFVAMTDTNGGNSTLSSLSTKAKAMGPAFGIFTGDLENDGVTASEMNPWISAMGTMMPITFPVRGNHDDHLAGSLTAWDGFFNQSQTATTVGATNYKSMSGYNDAVYSFDYGNSHFIGFDVPGDVNELTSQMISWMDQDLTQAEGRGLTHAFMYWHGPLYCFGGAHCSCSTKTCLDNASTVNAIVAVINKHPIVTATFHGHEHMYAWSLLDQTRIPSITRPIYQFVNGNSGGDNRTCNANRCDYQTNGHGFVLVTVEGLTVTVSWYNNGNAPPVNTKTFTKEGTVPPPSSRVVKYYGVDRATVSEFAKLGSTYHVNTIVMAMDVDGTATSWANVFNEAAKYGIRIVVWPADWTHPRANCGWESPYFNSGGDYITRVKRMLDSISGYSNFIGIVNAHEPFWSCISSIQEMETIKNQLKSYIRGVSGREVKIWNYVDNVDKYMGSDIPTNADIPRIMDVAVTWQHCFGGAEGTCENTLRDITRDRDRIEAAGGTVELVFLPQTFAISGTSYRMPTAEEMLNWGCQWLNTNDLDGFIWYTWGAKWYSQDLDDRSDLWPVMNQVFDTCVVGSSDTDAPAVPGGLRIVNQ